jgi:hypothetical protein
MRFCGEGFLHSGGVKPIIKGRVTSQAQRETWEQAISFAQDIAGLL